MKVLLAEDSATMRRLLATQLNRWEYDVVEARDGQQAWDAFQQQHFSLVLTDWMMPEIDGLELIRKIRASANTEYVYIVLLTTRSGNEDLVEAMEAGADDFLGKPCNPKELRVRLRAGERILQLEHTLITQNDELKEAQAALVQSEKLAGVGQLAAGMAHEINNPIAFVSNNIAVLQRDVQSLMGLIDHYSDCKAIVEQSDGELFQRLTTAEAECELPWLKENLPRLFNSSKEGLVRVREIVSNLRDFAHLDEAEIDHMDVVAAVDSVLQILASDIEEKQLTVNTNVADSDQRLEVLCQPAKIKQVLHSILRNAIQASRNGQTIQVSVSADTSSVCIEIEDHGQGMDETTQKRLFEPFYTTREVGSGQGLGLAVAYGVVQQHGGSIEFDSTLEKGSTFRVILPKSRKTI